MFPGRNRVFLLGDVNAQVGRNRDRWYSSLLHPHIYVDI